MSKNELALFGGPQAIDYEFSPYKSLGLEEAEAVSEVMRDGVLSSFLGCWHEDFYGGKKVKEFESACRKYFNVKHAITVNSWTSGLIAAVGAIGVEPGDEVIVTPWTMSATAMAILHWNAIPVFADIDRDTFNICPKSIRANITPRTKAIIAVDIFGMSADMKEIMKIADEFGLKVISDTAQAPAAKLNGKHAGTLADIGGFSLNYHKHIHTGEGGIVVTNDDSLAERVMLIRNHAESVVEGKGVENLSNMVGYNFRLGELECAIGLEQLKKLDSLVESRQKLAERLSAGLKQLKGIQTPVIANNYTHVYYFYPLILDVDLLGCSKHRIAEALKAEGVTVSTSYQNIHLLPIFQNQIAFGNKGFPWSADFYSGNVSYEKGICPVAEDLNDRTYIGFGMCVYDLREVDIDRILQAFNKVWSSLGEL